MKKKYWIGSILSALVIIGAVMMVQPSLALFTSQDTEINNFEAGDVDISIEEEFNGCTNFSEPCPKEVSIKNETLKTNAVIRVAIVPYWAEYVRSADGSILKDDKGKNVTTPWPGDVSGVTLHFGQNNSNLVEVDLDSNNVGWVDGGDGYYYYNRLVPAGASTRQLLSSVTVNVPSELQDRYKGKVLIVDVKAEAVQPTVEAVPVVWPNLSQSISDMLNNIITRGLVDTNE